MLRADKICVRAGKRYLLEKVDISIEPGRFTAVVGPNGAGKSTLLNVLSNEVRPSSGTVSLNGKILSSFRPGALSLVRAVLPQHTDVQFPFTAGQIIHLGRHAHRSTKEENDAIVREVIDITGTGELASRDYETLSGGERQRVQLARVLAQVWEETLYPRYILLDEPTSSLDIAQQQSIFGLTRAVCARNIGVMAIVHDLNQAVQFADNLYFMNAGKITAAGEAHQVFTKSNIEEAFCCHVNVYHDPCNNCPYIIPEWTGNIKLGVLK